MLWLLQKQSGRASQSGIEDWGGQQPPPLAQKPRRRAAFMRFRSRPRSAGEGRA